MKKFAPHLFFVMLLASCSTAYLVQSTKISDFDLKGKNDKTLVISMFAQQSIRANFETEMVTKLAENGYKSSTSLDLFLTTKLDKKLTNDELKKIVKEIKSKGFNKILITVLIDKQSHTEMVSSGVSVSYAGYGNYSGYPYNTGYGNFSGYWGAYQPYYYSSPTSYHEQTYNSYICETTLYDLEDAAKMLWAGRFKVENPASFTKGVDKYTTEIVDEFNKFSNSTAK